MFLDNGSCEAHRGGASQGEDIKSHYQPTLSGDPPHELGRAPHRLFAKCCDSLVNEQLAKGQEANGAQPGGHRPKLTWYRPCASFFLEWEDTTYKGV